ncbi:FtsK/SpoIIIE family DNA translocase [Clostridium tarantellae]|uniref:Cell division protein FtsK n=1 Tax=Clostridium tarantellae TaxID=39493 RepID=A0A6I1ML27_9CLOT|nr:DNA translocase FtsK [Clostridium tarantellae]MPQ43674.1 cell division protein FtsK [Clostridium tarantellae]
MVKKKKKKKSKQLKLNSEIYGLLVGCIMLILIFSLYTDKAGYLSILSKEILVNLMGVGAFIVPFYVIYAIIRIYVIKKEFTLSKIWSGVTLFLITTILFIQMLAIDAFYVDGKYLETLKDILSSGSYLHGGIIGFFIVLPIYKLIGKLGLYLILITLYIISSTLMFNYNLKNLPLILARFKDDSNKFTNKDNKNYEEDNSYIDIDKNLNEEDEFISNLDNKIKIFDFMKDSSLTNIDTEIAVEKNKKDEDNRNLEKTIIIPRESRKAEQKSLDSEMKETVNKEISQTISTASNVPIEYIKPNADLLNINTHLKLNKDDKKELLSNANKLEETLASFGVEAKILQVTKGPSVTRFELQPKAGVKVSKIVNLADDIALGLAASGVRIEAPIPGKSAIGIEVPNKEQNPVFFREILESKEFEENNFKVACALGKDITGKCIVTDLSKMPHVLIAGATGSGKSVCINTLIISILYKYSPEDVKLLMIDPKVVELSVYNGIPHLLTPVVTDPKKAAAALNWAVNEMTRRYKLFADNGVRNVDSYNSMADKGIIEEKLPYVVMIVDELADLMMVCPHDVEDYICRLAQMARAAGMHLVIATQRPSVDVITGVIKANIPSRISFAVSSQIDSRTILDSAGAEKLLGRGDMLFYPVGESKPLRIQGAFISEEEVEQIVSFVKNSQQSDRYEEQILNHINSIESGNLKSIDSNDELLDEAINIVVESGQASTSYLQRRLRIGFNRAARIMEQLEEKGIISGRDGSKPRQILISKEELENAE